MLEVEEAPIYNLLSVPPPILTMYILPLGDREVGQKEDYIYNLLSVPPSILTMLNLALAYREVGQKEDYI